jgi:large subunit ribosomal protein L23
MKSILTVTPRQTEKAYGLSISKIYVFNVSLGANKNDIAKEVEALHNVSVKKVRVSVQTGKQVRFSKGKRAQPGIAFRSNTKKAYVTLVAGDSIKVFDQPSETKVTTTADKKEKK